MSQARGQGTLKGPCGTSCTGDSLQLGCACPHSAAQQHPSASARYQLVSAHSPRQLGGWRAFGCCGQSSASPQTVPHPRGGFMQQERDRVWARPPVHCDSSATVRPSVGRREGGVVKAVLQNAKQVFRGPPAIWLCALNTLC